MFSWNDNLVKARVAEAIESASEKGAGLVFQAAKGSSDFHDKTGNLRESIKKAKSNFSNGGWVVYADAPHAHLVELGCRNGAQPPRPFMRNAKKSREAAVKRLYEQELAKI